MSENIFDRILVLMRKHGLNQSAFAKKAGMSASFLTDIKKGTTKISAGKIALICNAFSVNENWLLTGEGPMEVKITSYPATLTKNPAQQSPVATAQKVHKIPLISFIQCGGFTDSCCQTTPGYSEEHIDFAGDVGPNTFALRVVGDSMEPRFREGEIVIIDPSRHVNNGDFVVAKINNDDATLKKLAFDGGKTFLVPLNSRYSVIDVTDHELLIVGKVVSKVEMFA